MRTERPPSWNWSNRRVQVWTLGGIIAGAIYWLALIVTPHWNDTLAYYIAGLEDPYRSHMKPTYLAYLYSPAFTQAFEPLRFFAPEIVYALVSAAVIAALIWLAGPFSLLVIAIPLVLVRQRIPVPSPIGEAQVGNINMLMAAAAVASFRWPWLWALMLHTKVTPGVGVLWYAFRSEWRSFGIAVGATAGIASVSFALAPDLWSQWIDVLRDNGTATMPGFYIPVPLGLRLAIAVALLAWAAPRGHLWAVPLSIVLGTAWLGVPHLGMLVALLPFAAASYGPAWLVRRSAAAPTVPSQPRPANPSASPLPEPHG